MREPLGLPVPFPCALLVSSEHSGRTEENQPGGRHFWAEFLPVFTQGTLKAEQSLTDNLSRLWKHNRCEWGTPAGQLPYLWGAGMASYLGEALMAPCIARWVQPCTIDREFHLLNYNYMNEC